MPFLEHNFRGSIAKGAGHRGEDFIFGVEHLGNAKVGENERRISFGCKVEKVLWF
jgi:hypothetical protein